MSYVCIIFRLKDVLDDLLEITISDFEEVLKELNLLSGKGSSISYLSLLKIPILFLLKVQMEFCSLAMRMFITQMIVKIVFK